MPQRMRTAHVEDASKVWIPVTETIFCADPYSVIIYCFSVFNTVFFFVANQHHVPHIFFWLWVPLQVILFGDYIFVTIMYRKYNVKFLKLPYWVVTVSIAASVVSICAAISGNIDYASRGFDLGCLSIFRGLLPSMGPVFEARNSRFYRRLRERVYRRSLRRRGIIVSPTNNQTGKYTSLDSAYDASFQYHKFDEVPGSTFYTEIIRIVYYGLSFVISMIGIFLISEFTDKPLVDVIYFVFASITTIGFTTLAPQSTAGKLITICLVTTAIVVVPLFITFSFKSFSRESQIFAINRVAKNGALIIAELTLSQVKLNLLTLRTLTTVGLIDMARRDTSSEVARYCNNTRSLGYLNAEHMDISQSFLKKVRAKTAAVVICKSRQSIKGNPDAAMLPIVMRVAKCIHHDVDLIFLTRDPFNIQSMSKYILPDHENALLLSSNEVVSKILVLSMFFPGFSTFILNLMLPEHIMIHNLEKSDPISQLEYNRRVRLTSVLRRFDLLRIRSGNAYPIGNMKPAFLGIGSSSHVHILERHRRAKSTLHGRGLILGSHVQEQSASSESVLKDISLLAGENSACKDVPVISRKAVTAGNTTRRSSVRKLPGRVRKGEATEKALLTSECKYRINNNSQVETLQSSQSLTKSISPKSAGSMLPLSKLFILGRGARRRASIHRIPRDSVSIDLGSYLNQVHITVDGEFQERFERRFQDHKEYLVFNDAIKKFILAIEAFPASDAYDYVSQLGTFVKLSSSVEHYNEQRIRGAYALNRAIRLYPNNLLPENFGTVINSTFGANNGNRRIVSRKLTTQYNVGIVGPNEIIQEHRAGTAYLETAGLLMDKAQSTGKLFQILAKIKAFCTQCETKSSSQRMFLSAKVYGIPYSVEIKQQIPYDMYSCINQSKIHKEYASNITHELVASSAPHVPQATLLSSSSAPTILSIPSQLHVFPEPQVSADGAEPGLLAVDTYQSQNHRAVVFNTLLTDERFSSEKRAISYRLINRDMMLPMAQDVKLVERRCNTLGILVLSTIDPQLWKMFLEGLLNSDICTDSVSSLGSVPSEYDSVSTIALPSEGIPIGSTRISPGKKTFETIHVVFDRFLGDKHNMEECQEITQQQLSQHAQRVKFFKCNTTNPNALRIVGYDTVQHSTILSFEDTTDSSEGFVLLALSACESLGIHNTTIYCSNISRTLMNADLGFGRMYKAGSYIPSVDACLMSALLYSKANTSLCLSLLGKVYTHRNSMIVLTIQLLAAGAHSESSAGVSGSEGPSVLNIVSVQSICGGLGFEILYYSVSNTILHVADPHILMRDSDFVVVYRPMDERASAP